MSTASEAEELVRLWYKSRDEDLMRMDTTETGFDFRTRDRQTYIEVKGTTASRISDVLFRYLTNAQYERIKWSLRNKKHYWLHLVIGIGSENPRHYRIAGDFVLKNAKPEIWWSLPIRRAIGDFEIHD